LYTRAATGKPEWHKKNFLTWTDCRVVTLSRCFSPSAP
jgi:hypothetical protein